MILVLLMILGYGYILGREFNPRTVDRPVYFDRIEVQYRTAEIQEIKSAVRMNERDFLYAPDNLDTIARKKIADGLVRYLYDSDAIYFRKRTFESAPWVLQYGEIEYTGYLKLIIDPEYYKNTINQNEHGYAL